ncbi:MAG TPA: GPW/gp25 family protein [Allosphingosinicella sp.]|nr:GPW/gp25 family protein [Allosphingosinicella sp.]
MSPFGKGIAFPPKIGASGRMSWSEGERNVEESIAIILRTDRDERVGLPRFGTGLTAFLFEPNNVATHARIAHLIEAALKKWEPRIAVEDVEVAADPQAAETAVATIAYRLVASGAAATLAVNVPLAAG